MRPERRALLAACLGAPILAPWLARAQSAPDFAAVSAPVAALNAGLLAVMKAGSASVSFPQRFAMLAPVLTQSFDLPRILELAVGFDWASLTPTQQEQLLPIFREYTVASYVANFSSYGGEQFRILPGLRAFGSEQVVTTQIVTQDGKTRRIDYVMIDDGARWQVVDVLLDGTISQVAVQRSDFHALLSSGGASALISGLRRKVATLSGNTMS
ncbi:MAG TPA: ABC transporter substrate-binding protein [Acetobacteraceae bacterium]|nr:ABC transporter substrate-binding protein [Acetobacteraceae bacterium]